MRWDFLDMEEIKNMVYVVSCEIFCYFVEMFLLLLVVVLFYYFLIIGGKVLVLFVYGECVGWCVCLIVYVEIIWFNLCFYIVVVDVDRDIIFKDNIFFVGIVFCIK